MMKIKKVFNCLPIQFLLIILISLIIGFIFGIFAGVLTICGLVIIIYVIITVRQIYWKYKNIEDYENNNKKK